jgi:primosomal protein N' (replication factor Y) (superfamily II helicase)
VATRKAREREPAQHAPVARVCVEVSLAHLDRPFDYLVPSEFDEPAKPGVRVRVRFAGQLVDGFLLERAEHSDHPGKLAYLERVVSPEPVLSAEIAGLARAVADRYAGTLADVLRLAVPPRHARAEAEPVAPSTVAPAFPAPLATAAGSGGWRDYPAGPAFLRALADGRAARAVWSCMPGDDWPARLAEAVAVTVHSGRGAVVVVADARDLDRLDTALRHAMGDGRHVALSAALGPQQRYRRFLLAARGQLRAVAGTRAAALAPVHRLGLVAIWDDGDDLHAEPRAPYPHAREILLTRAQRAGCAALVGGYGRSVEAQQLLATGWARPIAARRETLRARAPAVHPASEDPRELAAARLPTIAWRAARAALAAGAPVLVQVPRRGYLPAVACGRCRTPARCPYCHGPLALAGASGPAGCRWCGRVAADYACPECGAHALRAAVTGARRTAEELGRAFPGVAVRTSGRDEVLATVPDEPAVVVATPGAEPVPEGRGYGAVLLLDTWALLTRADLRATEETLRRWLAAAALARPAPAGGSVVVVADGALAPVQALLRFDPATLAERELDGRRELGFPPAVRMASLTGTPAGIAELLAATRLPDGTDTLGPVPLPDGQQRVLLRVPRSAGAALAGALREATGVRSAKKAADPVRVRIDPLELL